MIFLLTAVLFMIMHYNSIRADLKGKFIPVIHKLLQKCSNIWKVRVEDVETHLERMSTCLRLAFDERLGAVAGDLNNRADELLSQNLLMSQRLDSQCTAIGRLTNEVSRVHRENQEMRRAVLSMDAKLTAVLELRNDGIPRSLGTGRAARVSTGSAFCLSDGSLAGGSDQGFVQPEVPGLSAGASDQGFVQPEVPGLSAVGPATMPNSNELLMAGSKRSGGGVASSGASPLSGV